MPERWTVKESLSVKEETIDPWKTTDPQLLQTLKIGFYLNLIEAYIRIYVHIIVLHLNSINSIYS